MKKIIFILIAGTILGICQRVSAKRVQVPKMYIFGMAASFNDTIVHFTNVQEIDSAWIDSKSKFLQDREIYSLQLKNFLTNHKQMPYRTCLVVANKSRKKLEKKYKKFQKLYTQSKDKKQHYDIRYLDNSEFQFYTVKVDNVDGDANGAE